jgi:DNA polymerase-4
VAKKVHARKVLVKKQKIHLERKIIHIDMDAFYTSVEQRDNPDLRGKPVVVGGLERGVVASASYEARVYGIRSAMPSVTALRKCPHLIFTKARFDVYRSVSQQIRAIFLEYTDLVEPLSLDEAYLDVTENKKGLKSAIFIAQQIRKEIFEQTQLTASAGVSINKFVAKVASDINKPNGIKVILPDEVIPFLEKLPVEKFHGIGKVTAQKMHNLGIRTGLDLKQRTELELLQRFGKAGKFYFNIVRGIDNRNVNPNRIRKSIGVERTYNEDITDIDIMEEKVQFLAEKLFSYVEKHQRSGRTLTLKIKYANFETATRSRTMNHDLTTYEAIFNLVRLLLHENMEEDIRVRLLGLTISNLKEKETGLDKQLKLPFP